jgi:hypothetical protein
VGGGLTFPLYRYHLSIIYFHLRLSVSLLTSPPSFSAKWVFLASQVENNIFDELMMMIIVMVATTIIVKDESSELVCTSFHCNVLEQI